MKKSIASLIVLVTLIPAFASGADFTPLTMPQYKLYSVCSNQIESSKEDLRLIAENFEFYHGKWHNKQQSNRWSASCVEESTLRYSLELLRLQWRAPVDATPSA